MDKQMILSLDKRESEIVDSYAKKNEISKYNAVKMIIRAYGDSQQ